MADKKKPNKKSADYVRPAPATFTLEKFPDVVFRFRKPTVEDIAWCERELGEHPLKYIQGQPKPLENLCRMYFHYLDDESQRRFVPYKRTARDPETGVEAEEFVNGSRVFMQSIEGGVPEVLSIAGAFARTMLSHRPLNDMPEEEKKRVERILATYTDKVPLTEPGPIGSEVFDLRK